jgi:hypothetical protein
MPQLVKGGKYAFGWSRVGEGGEIAVLPEALREYRLEGVRDVILVPGSRASGGFGIATAESLRGSPLAATLGGDPAQDVPKGGVVEERGRPYHRTSMREGRLTVPLEVLARYGIQPGDRILCIRGSGRAIGFAVRGPIVDEAQGHPELDTFQ